MKNNLLIVLIIFTLFSCERPYDGEKRIVVEGQLINNQNQPIANKQIEIYIGENNVNIVSTFLYLGNPPRQEKISLGNTDSNGKFKLAFPSPKNDENIEIVLNESYKNNSYQNKSIFGKISNFKNYRLDLGVKKLYNSDDYTLLKIIPVRVTPNASITDLNITALQIVSYDDLNNVIINQNNPFETQFAVIKNQSFEITYKLVVGATTTNQSIPITVGDVPVNYTLNY